MRVAQDLDRGGKRVDGPVDIVAGGPPEPFQPIGHLQGIEEGEETGVTGKAVVVVFLDPVVADPV